MLINKLLNAKFILKIPNNLFQALGIHNITSNFEKINFELQGK